jgi:integrase
MTSNPEIERQGPHRRRLTKLLLDQLRHTRPDRQYTVWDQVQDGLCVLVSPGSAHSHQSTVTLRVCYYLLEKPGSPRYFKIGRYPDGVYTFTDKAGRDHIISCSDLDAVRAVASDVRNNAKRGFDPRAEQEAEAVAKQDRLVTLQMVADLFMAARPHLRAKSRENYLGFLRHFDDWLDRPLRDITRDMVERRHKAIAAEVTARKPNNNGASSANSAMRVLRALWNFAGDRHDDLPPNPVRLRKQWFPEPRREGHVRPDDLATFYGAVQQLPNDVARDYLTLLLFTGMRRGEAASLTWEDIDLDARTLRIPEARTKAGRTLKLPLSDLVCEMLKARREVGGTTYVFPARGAKGYIAEPKFPLKQVAAACGVAITCHDLRRTFITVAESCGIDGFALKALVNHSLGSDVTGGYVQMSPERLREPMQKVTDKMKRLCGIDGGGGRVVALPQRRS